MVANFLFKFAQGTAVEIFDQQRSQQLGDGMGHRPTVAVQLMVSCAGGLQLGKVEQLMQLAQQVVTVTDEEILIDQVAQPEEQGREILVNNGCNEFEFFRYNEGDIHGRVHFLFFSPA